MPDPETRNPKPETLFFVFLALGLRAFGGPVAHLAIFRAEFVTRRGWLDDRAYADLVALCQFLPGPTSSQIGMVMGWRQAGLRGLLAAWAGFTLPGAVLMIAAGLWLATLPAGSVAPWLHGMQIAVLAIVAGAVATMWRSICTDSRRGALALATAALVLIAPQAWMQLPILAATGLAGWWLPKRPETDDGVVSMPAPGRRTAITCLVLLAPGLCALPLLGSDWGRTAADLFRTGSLVIGGGHVVLPLLSADVVDAGRLPTETFLAGYGIAQAVPGPMFNLAGFLGAAMHGPGWAGICGGILATVAIFLPGALLVLAALPAWEGLRRHVPARRIVDGLCVGVVGLLIAALWNPIATSAVHAPADVALACLAMAALLLRLPAWAVVAGCAGISALAA